MVVQASIGGFGGWTVGPVLGRRPAGAARDAVHPGTGARAVLVIVDGRFTGRGFPDPERVARAAIVGSPAVMPMLDAGLLEDGTRWYVTPAVPGPVLDPAAGCSPRRAATIAEGVARALAAVHGAGLVHGLIGPSTVVPPAGRHSGGAVGTTLLLDTGVAALLGDRADELATASGVSLPTDRGPAADVYALGALLLRLLTAAAPAGPALAALPDPLRSLLSAMLDEHPSRRPTADAVARSLAGMREELLGTGPVELPRPVPVPLPRGTSAPVATASRPVPRVVAAQELLPRAVVPAPIRAPQTVESPVVVPRSTPSAAPSLWTGPVPIVDPARPGRRRGTRILLLAGGVGLAGIVLGVATHLPLLHVEPDQAVAAVAADGGLSVADAPATGSASGSATTVPGATKAPKHRAASASPPVVASAPAFARPTKAVPSPLKSSASSTTPSRTTATPVSSGSGRHSSAPVSASPSSSAPSTSSTTVTSDPSASATATSTDSPTSTDASSSSTPPDTATSTEPATSDPSPSASTSTDPSVSSTPSADASAS